MPAYDYDIANEEKPTRKGQCYHMEDGLNERIQNR